MVVIGGIIGAGIFITPHIVAEKLDTPLVVLGAWVMGGANALAGAFSYAELGAVFPKAGGRARRLGVSAIGLDIVLPTGKMSTESDQVHMAPVSVGLGAAGGPGSRARSVLDCRGPA